MKLLTNQLNPKMDTTMPTAHVIMAFTTAANMGQPRASERGLASGSGSAVDSIGGRAGQGAGK
jgi:hypothetical protein